MNQPKRILDPRTVVIRGITMTLGYCPICGRQLRPSEARNIGARCHYEGTQFDRSGVELYSLVMAPEEIRSRKAHARRVYEIYPTEAVQVRAS